MRELLTRSEREQYLEGWRGERARGRAMALERARKEALERVVAAARLAREKYGVRRVVVFGSLATGGFGEDSDVDLCVEGLGDQGLYYPLHGDLERVLLPFRLHLVLEEDLESTGADRALRQEIAALAKVVAQVRDLTESRDVTKSVPKGEAWHAALLDQVAHEVRGVRPAIISRDLYRKLNDYRSFRHVGRHAYGYELRWEKMRPLVENLPSL